MKAALLCEYDKENDVELKLEDVPEPTIQAPRRSGSPCRRGRPLSDRPPHHRRCVARGDGTGRLLVNLPTLLSPGLSITRETPVSRLCPISIDAHHPSSRSDTGKPLN